MQRWRTVKSVLSSLSDIRLVSANTQDQLCLMAATDMNQKIRVSATAEHAHDVLAVHVRPCLQSSTHRELACALIEVDVVDATDATCDGNIACRQTQASLHIEFDIAVTFRSHVAPAAASNVRQASRPVCCCTL